MEEQQQTQVDTKHEPHEHAHKRLLVGLLTVVVLVVLFFYVWPHWGDEIKETCLGDGEVCSVSLPGATIDGTQE